MYTSIQVSLKKAVIVAMLSLSFENSKWKVPLAAYGTTEKLAKSRSIIIHAQHGTKNCINH
jgi:hypothetical protein